MTAAKAKPGSIPITRRRPTGSGGGTDAIWCLRPARLRTAASVPASQLRGAGRHAARTTHSAAHSSRATEEISRRATAGRCSAIAMGRSSAPVSETPPFPSGSRFDMIAASESRPAVSATRDQANPRTATPHHSTGDRMTRVIIYSHRTGSTLLAQLPISRHCALQRRRLRTAPEILDASGSIVESGSEKSGKRNPA